MEVPVFDFHAIHRCRRDGTPWELLRKVPKAVTDQILHFYLKRSDIEDFITSNFKDHKSKIANDYAYVKRALDRNKFQLDWSSIILPALCSYSKCFFVSAYSAANLMQPPPVDASILKREYVKEMIKHRVFVGSLSNSLHFQGYMVIFPEKLDHGYLLCMDPLGCDITMIGIFDQIQNLVNNLTCCRLTEGFIGDGRELPKMKAITVTHPPHLTQRVGSGPDSDVSCSYWTMILLSHWINAFTEKSGGDSDKFIELLDGIFSSHSNSYDFTRVSQQETAVDRNYSIKNIGEYCLLFLQYLAQVEDLKKVVEAHHLKGDTVESVYRGSSNRTYDYLQSIAVPSMYPKYITAGHRAAVSHMENLRKSFYSHTKPGDVKTFLQGLPLIDVVRLSLLGVDNFMTNSVPIDCLVYGKMEAMKVTFVDLVTCKNCRFFINDVNVLIPHIAGRKLKGEGSVGGHDPAVVLIED
jgi:hypothetical protein